MPTSFQALSILFVISLFALGVLLHKRLQSALNVQAKNPREALVMFVTFIAGLYFVLEYVLPAKMGEFQFGLFHEQIILGVRFFGSVAIGLGIINLVRVHGATLLKSKRGWPNSLALLLSMLVVFVIYISDFISKEERYQATTKLSNLKRFAEQIVSKTDAQERTDGYIQIMAVLGTLALDSRQSDSRAFSASTSETYRNFMLAIRGAELESIKSMRGESNADLVSTLAELETAGLSLAEENYNSGSSKAASEFVFQGFFVPLGSAMFSLLAFYVATAAYRTFRIRSFEALVMMLAAIIVMLGQIPHGPLYISSELPALRLWLLEYINTPAFRGILIGSAIAALAQAVRMWLSVDSNPLNEETK